MNNPHILYALYMINPQQIYTGGAGDGGGFLKCTAIVTESTKYLNVEQRAHWLPIQERTNQLCHVIMMSSCQVELYPSRVSCQNFGFIYC